MDLFHKIEGAVAIVRGKNGVFKQSDVYHRGETVFVKHGGGFLRIIAGLGDEFGTTHPDVKVVDFEAEGVTREDYRGPRFILPLKAAA